MTPMNELVLSTVGRSQDGRRVCAALVVAFLVTFVQLLQLSCWYRWSEI
jgi:hypothetical protein